MPLLHCMYCTVFVNQLNTCTLLLVLIYHMYKYVQETLLELGCMGICSLILGRM